MSLLIGKACYMDGEDPSAPDLKFEWWEQGESWGFKIDTRNVGTVEGEIDARTCHDVKKDDFLLNVLHATSEYHDDTDDEAGWSPEFGRIGNALFAWAHFQGIVHSCWFEYDDAMKEIVAKYETNGDVKGACAELERLTATESATD